MKKMIVYCVLLIMWVFSCSSDLHDEISRTYNDPVIQEPVVQSIVERNTILVSWDADYGTDAFVLERKTDTESSVFEEVYRGTSHSFVDTLPEGRYLYRLRFRRGRRVFGPSDQVLGISSSIVRDEHEPNDNQANATYLENTTGANLFFYKSLDGQEVYDHDWYYIVLPPRSYASVSVDDDTLEGTGVLTHFDVYLHGLTSYPVADNHAFDVDNRSNDRCYVYFYLAPRPDKYLDDEIAGGSVIRYNIQIREIVYMVD